MKKHFGHPRLSRVHFFLSIPLSLTLIIGLTPAISVQANSTFYTPPSSTVVPQNEAEEEAADLPVEADKVIVQVDPNQETEIHSSSGKITIKVPQGAVPEPVCQARCAGFIAQAFSPGSW